MNKWIRSISMILVCAMLLVFGTVEAKASTEYARVYLAEYELVEGIFAPGENVKLALTFTNPNKKLEAYNIMFTYATENSNVRPVYGKSNQVYIDRIGPEASVTVEIELLIPRDVVAGEMVMGYYVSYGDDTYSSYEYSASIAAPLTGTCQIMIEEIYVPEANVKGHNSLISVGYANVGTVKIEKPVLYIACGDNVKQLELESLYAGEKQSVEYYFMFEEVGVTPVTISMSYSDSDGFTYSTDVYEYAVSVAEETENSGSKLEEVTPEGFSDLYLTNTQLCIIAAFAVFAMIVGIVLFGNKKKTVK